MNNEGRMRMDTPYWLCKLRDVVSRMSVHFHMRTFRAGPVGKYLILLLTTALDYAAVPPIPRLIRSMATVSSIMEGLSVELLTGRNLQCL